MTHEITIPVAQLDAGGKEYKFVLRAAWMRGALEGSDASAAGPDGALEVRASKSGNDVVVHGTLRADLVAPCARCLQPAPIRVDQPFSVLMVPEKAIQRLESGEHELGAEEADVVAYDGDTVVLDDVVRDELLLETPMIPLCREDCPGMSPSPGETPDEPKPLDPRLMPLLRLKTLKNKE